MTSEEFASELGKLIAEALKAGLPTGQIEVELETALDLLDGEPAPEATEDE